MKSRTSFFNIRVLGKHLSRFAPLWILYAVAQVLGLMSLGPDAAACHIASDLCHIMGPVSIFHAGYALLVAACLFGDLFDSRLCNGLHAMPMRREGWLLTGLAAGLLFALIPAVVAGSFALILLGEYWWLALVWQGVSLLQYVFFFGVAVFSALCAGKRLGMAAIYAIVNFLSMLIYWIATMIYEPLLPGVELSDQWFSLFCPLVHMSSDSYCNFYINWSGSVATGVFKGFEPQAFLYLYVCAGVGLVLLVLSWFMYRRRALETAGDFVSFRSVGFIFLLAYTFAVGAFVYSFGELFGLYKNIIFLVIGILIGWFTGWMLLERRVKIFTKKTFLGFAAFALIFCGSLAVTRWDPLGITTYVPAADKVERASMYLQQDRFHYESSGLMEGWYVTDPQQIQQIRDHHTQMLATTGQEDGRYLTVYVCYDLENGFRVKRSYQIPAQTQTALDLNTYFSDIRSVLATDDIASIRENLMWANVYLYGGDVHYELKDAQQLQQLFAALEADADAGTLAQHDYLHFPEADSIAGIDLAWEITWQGRSTVTESYSTYLTVYDDCDNFREFLETLVKTQ